ncbi:MAG: hypothetical protein KAT28_03345 [Candidatus Aenigmarchaeota archaeon]|nr:hypothetical protein [Candidatus Aenigmarchaeota archaeon]
MILEQDQQLIERLEKYGGNFEQIRACFNLEDRIGFGSLPNAHNVYSLGMLIDVFGARDGRLGYSDNQGFFPEKGILPEDEAARIIISPNTSKDKPYLVSVYQKKGWWDGDSFEPRILGVPDLVLDGLVAHELSHWVKEYGQLPVNVQRVLKQREQDFIKLCKDASEYAGKFGREAYWDFMDQYYTPTNGEADIDIIASLYGYKEEVIAKIDYTTECLKTYNGPDEDTQYVTPKQAIQQMEFHKKEVQRYG